VGACNYTLRLWLSAGTFGGFPTGEFASSQLTAQQLSNSAVHSSQITDHRSQSDNGLHRSSVSNDRPDHTG